MAQGVITRVVSDKGFGFVEAAGHAADFFFHASDLSGLEFDDQLQGRRVVFEPSTNARNGKAKAIRVRPAS